MQIIKLYEYGLFINRYHFFPNEDNFFQMIHNPTAGVKFVNFECFQ